MLATRTLTALWFAPLFLFFAWMGNPWFALLLAFMAFLGAGEYHRLNPYSLRAQLLIWTPLLVLSPLFLPESAIFPLVLFAFLSCLILPLILELPLAAGGQSFVGIFYIGGLLAHLAALRSLAWGREWTLFTVLVTFAVDTGAYFVGRSWGRHRPFPSLSPGKTLEGSIGGIASGILAGIILAYLFSLPLKPLPAALLGLVLSLLAQLGDLVESRIKREAGAKDSGRLLPGHGGILDRIDSLVFTAPLVYYYVAWLSQ